ncbi:MAG: phage terminase small subunit P27 family [Planctomycetota bacterium]|nr:phage terminase small subunit P27 family [Planctomycetota bacterium]
MGRRGPAPTPTSILQMRGSTLVNQRRLADEPTPPPGLPRCPAWLDVDTKAAWKQLAPTLGAMGCLTRIDANALARYCRLWARWRKAEAFIDKHGEVYSLKDDVGKTRCVQQWPQVAIANKLTQQLSRLEAEFGMTPSARSRIQIEKPKVPNSLDRFLLTRDRQSSTE